MIRIRQSALVLALLAPLALRSQSLILNDQQPQVVIYEVPAGDSAVVVKALEFLRGRFWPNAEIVDATALDDAALRAKIKGPFVLYSLLDERSRLLKLAAQPTPFRLENGTLHWRDLATPAAGVRMVFVGKNPFGDGFGSIYAAGTPDLLARANAVFHGPKSYHIYQGETLLRDGTYDRNFKERLDHISRDEAVADTNQYFATIEYVHPNPLAHQTAEQYRALKQRTLDAVSAKPEVQISDLTEALVHAAATFRDGHTGVYADTATPKIETLAKIGFPPFWLAAENGHFFVAAATDPALVGVELLAVNGKDAAKFFEPLCDLIPGETLVWKAERFTGEQSFYLPRAPVFGGPGAPLALKVRDLAGSTKDISLTTLGVREYQKFFEERAVHTIKKRDGRGTRVEFLDSGRVAHLILPACNRGDPEQHKIDEIFAQIDEQKSKTLILDIRGNPGGTTNIIDYLFRYVHEGKFAGASRLETRFIRDVPEAVWKGEFPTPQPPMKVYDQKEQGAAKPHHFFKGRVYLMIDNGTFSSAVYCAVLFRDYKAATLVGYETGGVPQSFGSTHPFQLKNSGIHCNVSDRIIYPPKPRPGDDQHGVLPDVPLDRTKLAPYDKEPDPALAFTLAHLDIER